MECMREVRNLRQNPGIRGSNSFTALPFGAGRRSRHKFRLRAMFVDRQSFAGSVWKRHCIKCSRNVTHGATAEPKCLSTDTGSTWSETGRFLKSSTDHSQPFATRCAHFVESHHVVVVKPIVARKILVQQDEKGGRVLRRRKSPKRCGWLDAFDELIYFTQVFPHPNLSIEIVLVEIEEWRYPGHGRRRRRRGNDFQVEDRKLVAIEGNAPPSNGRRSSATCSCATPQTVRYGAPRRSAEREALGRPAGRLLSAKHGIG